MDIRNWIEEAFAKHANSIPSCCLIENKTMLICSQDQLAMLPFKPITGKPILKKRIKTNYRNFSVDGKQLVTSSSAGVIQFLDCTRGHFIKYIQLENSRFWYQWSNHVEKCTLNLEGKLIFLTPIGGIRNIDAASSVIEKTRESLSELYQPVNSLSSQGNYAAEVNDKRGTVTIWKRIDLYHKIVPCRGSNIKDLSLKGTIINNAVGLSEENILLFQKKGDYRFSEDVLQKLLIPSLNTANVLEIYLTGYVLDKNRAKIIGKELFWINLRKLNLSNNRLYDSVEEIAKNQSWPHLEELILVNTNTDDRIAKLIAKNETWKNLKRLELASNKIELTGLTSICSSSIWKSLKVLRLEENSVQLQVKDIMQLVESLVSRSLELLSLPRVILNSQLLQYLKRPSPENVIEVTLTDRKYSDEQLAVIGSNRSWTNLKKLNLSMNKLTDVCGRIIGNNTAWCNLEELNLSRNQLEKESGIAIGTPAGKSLQY